MFVLNVAGDRGRSPEQGRWLRGRSKRRPYDGGCLLDTQDSIFIIYNQLIGGGLWRSLKFPGRILIQL